MSGENQQYDVAIVGVGPAGLAAAQIVREHGLSVVIIDEQMRAGGQILRQPPRGFRVEKWLNGRLYARPKSVLETMDERDDVDWRMGATVLGIMRRSGFRPQAGGHDLWIRGASGCYVLAARAVLLAPGCYERPLAFPGWTLPGVMGAGAIQGFLKSQQFVPGERFVLAGSHPLQLVVADQLVSAGAEVAAVIFTQRLGRVALAWRHALAVLQHGPQLFETARIVARLRRAGVPLCFGSTIVEAHGERVLERVVHAPVSASGEIDRARARTIECDRLGVCHGFLASSELARQAGASVHWREHEGGWVVDHDRWFESSVAKLFVAGEIAGVAGADAAVEKGRVAAIGVLRALGAVSEGAAERLARIPRRRLARISRFAAMLSELSRPPERLAQTVMTEDSILCRCESIQRGTFERFLQEHPHIRSLDAAKLVSRVGMGLCQGRLCADNAAHLLAATRKLDMKEVAPFRAQAPVKPVPLEALRPERCG